MQTGLWINYLCATFDHLYIISPSLSGIGLCRVDYRDDNLPAVMLWKQKYAKKFVELVERYQISKVVHEFYVRVTIY